MSNRVHGIMILVGAGLDLPKTRPLTSRRAQQAAPLRSKSHNDRHSRDPHHSLKSLKDNLAASTILNGAGRFKAIRKREL